MRVGGRCWVYGDDVNTDVIYPQRYSYLTDPAEMKRHAMEGIDPGFTAKVRQGDIIVAGLNFGCGSSMEHAPLALKSAGVGAIVASSFARIFYRNAVSLGIPLVESRETVEGTDEGDVLEINLKEGTVVNATKGTQFRVEPLPEYLMRVLETGGLIPYLKTALKSS